MSTGADEQGIGAVLWDLDGTLWDHVGAVDWALRRFCERGGVDFELFRPVYLRHSDRLWELYEQGRATVEEVRFGRFRDALGELGAAMPGLDEETERYLVEYGSRPRLLPGAREALLRLHGRVPMALLTNGFADTQRAKIEVGDLGAFFDMIAISAEVGAHKPRPELFHHALRGLCVAPAAAIHVGDSWPADVVGAAGAGLAGAIWVRRDGREPSGPLPESFRLAVVEGAGAVPDVLAGWGHEDPTQLVRGAAATTLVPERSSPIGVGVAVGVVPEAHPVAGSRDWPCP